MKRTVVDSFVIGFALFSMFFGAGNVIFPPQLGRSCEGDWFIGFLAYYLADVGLALLALTAVLRKGSPEAVLSSAGRRFSRALLNTVVLCIGPLLAIPRTAATTYEMSVLPLAESIPPALFSAVFFALILLLCLRRSAVVDVVGKVLTPLLLAGLLLLIVKGVLSPPGQVPGTAAESAVVIGVEAGYQTMDVLAALVFGILILNSVGEKGYAGAARSRVVIGAGAVAGAALFAVYLGLTWLGASASAVPAASRTELMVCIVETLLGRYGVVLFAVVTALACVTTAAALVSAAAAHFAASFSTPNAYAWLTVGICLFSTVVSCFGLEQIVSVSAPILSIVYPPVLALVLLSFREERPRFARLAALGALAVGIFTAVR